MSIPRVTEPLGRPEPYIIPANEGEAVTLPGSKATIRFLASAKETNNLISVFHMDGITGDAPGFHFHNKAHDIFMCVKGKMKVWAGDKCRVLSPGDFASVPPEVIHQPQLMDPFNESIGFITPGHWVDFFRFIGEKYEGVVTNEFDARNIMETLMPKFMIIKEKYDVIFQPQFVGAELGEWTAEDTKIPEGIETYYLKANTGPTFLLGGVLSRPFITTKQSGGKFAITSIESSNRYTENPLAAALTLPNVHQVYTVLDGTISVTVDGKMNAVHPGETVFIPAGTTFSVNFLDRYVRFWSFASGDALETLISKAGGAYEGKIVPEKARTIDGSAVSSAATSIGLQIAS
ncbi:putative dioxygenase [Cadophora sp. DSE1049]|nr:putative dioxygenase [Cadophora sp. DSE1049]